MTPTAKLRFVERDDIVVLNGEEFNNHRIILQQWWVTSDESYEEWRLKQPGEWRDVPLEKKA